jgi:hypothetical protein
VVRRLAPTGERPRRPGGRDPLRCESVTATPRARGRVGPSAYVRGRWRCTAATSRSVLKLASYQARRTVPCPVLP